MHQSAPEPGREEKVSNPRYIRIDLDARKALGITVGDYALLAVIDILSRKTGWCFASQEYLSRTLGVSDRSIRRMIERLREARLIEGSGSLRPAPRFYKASSQSH